MLLCKNTIISNIIYNLLKISNQLPNICISEIHQIIT